MLTQAVDNVLSFQQKSKKPLAIILAGHNGSGKSTMWRISLADRFRIPLINADRMMLSVLPESFGDPPQLPDWATNIRDNDEGWMHVAQDGVQAFVAHALARKVPFAMETVFSEWRKENGRIRSKIDLIQQMQKAGYFVLLFFVGLSNAQVSEARVLSRVAQGGHSVDRKKIIARFPRTQKAIRKAITVADAAILTDNSRLPKDAFTVCRVQLGSNIIYDRRVEVGKRLSLAIFQWLNKVCPL
jgi:predicted ABC-type ATPase